MVFHNTRDIPRVGLAYAEAEGFIVPPGLPWSKKERDERELEDGECPDREDCDEKSLDAKALEDKGSDDCGPAEKSPRDKGRGDAESAGVGEKRPAAEPEAALRGPGGRKAANG